MGFVTNATFKTTLEFMLLDKTDTDHSTVKADVK